MGPNAERLFAYSLLGPVFALLFSQPLIPFPPEMTDSLGLLPRPAQEVRLSSILNKAIRYCRRLESVALDFVCLEEISEKIDYSRDKEDEIAIIDAAPKKTFTGTHGYGRVWIREGDGSVLKIEWKPESVPDLNGLEMRAQKYGSELSLTLVTEYGFEKNGIRFPSRDYSEEAYLKPDGKKFIRSRTSVAYRDYKFFTVETDIKY